ncbi:MAG TPA: energy transducer TonB [Candidatus Binatia bacterium]
MPMRWMAALALSLGCHALLLAMLPMLGAFTFPPERPIAVTLLGGGGGSDGGGAGEGGGDARGSEAAAPVEETEPAPAEGVAALAPTPPVAAPLHPRAQALRREAMRRAPARRAVAPEAPPQGPAGAGGASEAAASRGGGIGDGTGTAEGSGTGSGHGDGVGNGAGGGDGGGDLRASCASCPAPEYPARARRQGWQGTVDVAVRVGGDGAVEEAQVGRSSGFAALDTAAVSVARRSRFRVAGGTAVSGQLRYRFVLEAGERPL